MRGELEIPFQLPGIGVKGHHAIAVKVVAAALVAVVVGPRITNTPVGEVVFGIVRASDPNRGAAMLPRISRPRLVSRFALAGNCVEPPRFVAGGGVVGGNETADAIFPAGRTHNHFVLHNQGRVGERIAGFGPGHLFIPQHLAVRRVHCHKMGIDSGHKQGVAQNRNSAVDSSATGAGVARRQIRIKPFHRARGRIQRHNIVGRLSEVHGAIHHQRRGLELLH